MTIIAVSKLGALQETLGYVFRDVSLLRLALTHPGVAAAVTPLARQYARLRYGPPTDPGELREFTRAARRFERRKT